MLMMGGTQSYMIIENNTLLIIFKYTHKTLEFSQALDEVKLDKIQV